MPYITSAIFFEKKENISKTAEKHFKKTLKTLKKKNKSKTQQKHLKKNSNSDSQIKLETSK